MKKEYATYLLHKTQQDYNLIAKEFSRTRSKPWQEIQFLFENYLNSNDKVLDIGCGNGRFFEFCKNKNIDYIGVDNAKELIRAAKEKFPEAKFQTADAFDLPFPKDSFNKIYSIAVLHHIPSRKLRLKFLEEAKRVLKPEGFLILTVWKFHQPKERFLLLKFTILKLFKLSKFDFRDILEPWGKKLQRYYHCFSKKGLRRLVEDAGFEIEDLDIVKNDRGNRQNIFLIAQKTKESL